MARLAVGLLAAACLLLAAVPKAHAGAVFEVREPVPTRDADYKFTFDQVQAGVTGGSIVRPTGPNARGAGAVFAATSIPMSRFTLNRCVSVAPHIHPNGAEFVYCLTGTLRVVQFRGEEDGTNVRTVDLQPGDAAYIGQGSVHFVVNTNRGPSSFLQLFDHPQAGTVFVASALVNLPRNVINSAFSRDILPASGNSITATPPPLIPIRQCPY